MTPADTPAPSPSPESSALDALLMEVDDLNARGVFPEGFVQAPSGEYVPLKSKDARLAAIVRVLREAVKQAASFGEGPVVGPEFDCPYHAMEARHALARAEAIAKGE